MAQGPELTGHDRRSHSSSADASEKGRLRHTVAWRSPGKPAAPGDEQTLDALGVTGPVGRAGREAEPTMPPTSSERLAMLAAQLPCVAREAYTVGREVAKGGIGRVLRARDERLDRPVAIKELLVWNEKQEQRFVREALLTARLQHPAIVPIYEAGRWPDGEPFYVMKLVSGRSLADLIGERKSLEERLSLLPHIVAVAQAIAYAHSKKIIHRDLKPANVLVGEFGETVVIDWGLAKDLAEEDAPETEGEARAGEGLTLQGAIVGTPSYMPPEQASGRTVDERADVYALGAMLYHLLAAVPPYHDAPWEKLLTTIAEKAPRRIEKLAPRISDELAAIVHKAMARDPEDRYRTARELSDDLERFQTGQIVAAHTYSAGQLLRRYWRRNRSALSIAATALSLVALVVIVAFVKTDRDRHFAQLKEREATAASRAAETARQAAVFAGEQATTRADEMTLLQAQDALLQDPNRALAWLKTLSPQMTDVAEVRRLASDAQARGISRAFRGHTAHVNHIGVAPSGKRFVTASDDKTVRIWDTASGSSIVLRGHTDEVWNAVFLPDEKTVASVSKDSTLRLWDADTGAEVNVIQLPSASRQVIGREDGAIVGTPIRNGVPWIWRPGTAAAKPIVEPKPNLLSRYFHNGQKLGLVVPREGTSLYDMATGKAVIVPRKADTSGTCEPDYAGVAMACDAAGEIELWSLSPLASKKIKSPGAVLYQAVTPRGDRVAFAVDDVIYVHDMRTGALLQRLTGHAGAVTVLTFSSDGRSLASGAFDRTIRSWDIVTGESQAHAGLEGAVSDVQFLPDQRTLVATSKLGEVRLFEPRRAGRALTDHGTSVTGVAVSTGKRVASIDERGLLRITTLDGGKIAEHALRLGPFTRLKRAPDGHGFAGFSYVVPSEKVARAKPQGAAIFVLGSFDGSKPREIEMAAPVRAASYLPDSRAVIVALSDGSVQRVDADGRVAAVDKLAAPASVVAVSADGAWVAAGGDDGTVRLTELATGRHRELRRHSEGVSAIDFSEDGRTLVTGCWDHTARIWRLEDGSFRSLDEGGHGVIQIELSKDGKTLFLLSKGETQIRRIDVATGEHLPPFGGQEGTITGFSISADEQHIVTCGSDGAARIVSRSTGKGRTLVGRKSVECRAVFSPDNRTVITIADDGTVRAWPDDLPETMPELRAWIAAATPDRIEGK